ncbi:hypothetical protein [Halostella litorea]|uniref:hypothetical protein n=1 Tax=Halostella litorea TaxID=2528831 RepID=UPI0010924BB8|nr:hypothetical protein [Halostella litorea]
MVSALYRGFAVFALLVVAVLVGAVLAYRRLGRDDDGVSRLDRRVDLAFRAGVAVGAPAVALGIAGVIAQSYLGDAVVAVAFALLVLGTGLVTLTTGGMVANLILVREAARD